jgi:hypothetical protein
MYGHLIVWRCIEYSLLDYVGGIAWTRPISSLWIPCTLMPGMKDWWAESVVSGKVDDQINDFARSVGWEFDAQGALDNQRNFVANLPFELLLR